MLTGLLNIVLMLAVFGLITWLILTYIPMPPPIKNVIIAIIVIVLIVFLLNFALGHGAGLGRFGCT